MKILPIKSNSSRNKPSFGDIYFYDDNKFFSSWKSKDYRKIDEYVAEHRIKKEPGEMCWKGVERFLEIQDKYPNTDCFIHKKITRPYEECCPSDEILYKINFIPHEERIITKPYLRPEPNFNNLFRTAYRFLDYCSYITPIYMDDFFNALDKAFQTQEKITDTKKEFLKKNPGVDLNQLDRVIQKYYREDLKEITDAKFRIDW